MNEKKIIDVVRRLASIHRQGFVAGLKRLYRELCNLPQAAPVDEIASIAVGPKEFEYIVR